MLPKVFRLKKQYEFRYVYRKGNKAFSKFITLFYSKNKFGEYKFGFSVSKKYGNSVERNRIKRLFRAVIKTLILRIKKEYNYVFIIRPEIKGKSYLEVYEIVLNILTVNRLINE